MVTLLIFLIVLVNSFLFLVVLPLIRVFFGLEPPLLGIRLRPEASLRLPHLVELLRADMIIIFKNFLFLVTGVLILQPLNNSIRLLPPLMILQIVHVQLILQVINVGVLLHINRIESF